MRQFIRLLVGLCALWPVAVCAQSSLESPTGFVSGLGDIHGWKCSGNNFTYTIDSGPPGQLIYGANRGDTQGICGDSTNGFITQFNWNLIGSGVHTIRVFDNGVQFGQSTFTVTTMGVEFLTGASSTATTTINGQNVTLTWQQNQQNFVITNASGGGGDGAICTTKTGTAHWFDDVSTWTITNPCTGSTLNISIVASNTGFFACGGDLDFVQGGMQFGDADFTWRDTTTNSSVCQDLLPGITKNTVVTVDSGVPLDFTQPFSIFYDDEKVVDFP